MYLTPQVSLVRRYRFFRFRSLLNNSSLTSGHIHFNKSSFTGDRFRRRRGCCCRCCYCRRRPIRTFEKHKRITAVTITPADYLS
ncbi:hypothetical protein Hanom_Chr12g01111811 [Helianthus anomalus]